MKIKPISFTLVTISLAALFGCSGSPPASKGSWGYVDRTGKVVIPAQFAEGRDFADGMAAVKIKDNWGYIDRTGKVVITPQFAAGRRFADGMAAVKIQGS